MGALLSKAAQALIWPHLLPRSSPSLPTRHNPQPRLSDQQKTPRIVRAFASSGAIHAASKCKCFDGFGQTGETQRFPCRVSVAAPWLVRHNVDGSESRQGCTRQPLNFPAVIALQHKAPGQCEDPPDRRASSVQTGAYPHPDAPTLQLAGTIRTNASPQNVA